MSAVPHREGILTRGVLVSLMLLASFALPGCASSLHSQSPPKWSTGFWYWGGRYDNAVAAEAKPDALYVRVGRIWKYASRTTAERWSVYGELPDSLPEAREYWLLFRLDEPGVPDVSAAPELVHRIVSLLQEAQRRQIRVAGVQLDIDSPTARLPEYARFLREFRAQLPPNLEVSITALLDWFRNGTSVADVLKQTDEFVPQFYDIGPRGSADDGSAVAAKIDAAEWAPKFNRFGKRFRIGVSTFGRARIIPRDDPSQTANGFRGVSRIFGDLTPLDVAGNAAFQTQTSRNEANELVLDYRAVRNVQIGYSRFQPGDRVQFILSTPDSVRAAVASVRRIGGHCAGVIFFRWPASNETLVMQPDDALSAAGIAPARVRAAHLELVSGHCAAVNCVDLYLLSASAFSARPIRYRVHSSVDLEYFLPEERIPVRMAGAAELEVTFPPYGARSRLLLGRAVTESAAEYRVEEEP